MLNDPRLLELQTKIEHGETTSVKAMLLTYLRENPDSADAWWLLSRVADTEADRLMWLQKALSFDPNHAGAKLDYAPFQFSHAELPPVSQSAPHQTSPYVASVSIFPVHTPAASSQSHLPPAADDAILQGDVPLLMEGVAAVYHQLGWVVTAYQHQDSIVEKNDGLSWGRALVLLPIPLVGLAVFISSFFLRRHYRMHLTLLNQGDEIEIRGHGMRTVLNHDNVAVGGLPIPKTPNRLQAYALGGLLSGLCYFLILWVWLR